MVKKEAKDAPIFEEGKRDTEQEKQVKGYYYEEGATCSAGSVVLSTTDNVQGEKSKQKENSPELESDPNAESFPTLPSEVNRSTTDEHENDNQKKAETRKQSVYLFFSFDVVNSTEYKTNNRYEWIRIIDWLFKELDIQVKKALPSPMNPEMWRIIGDEVVFVVNIRSQEYIEASIARFYTVLVETNEAIRNGRFFEKIPYYATPKETDKKKWEHLFFQLQATAWIAVVHRLLNNQIDESYVGVDNVLRVVEGSNNNRFLEFWGNDIDTGFRLSKFTRANRLVISVELAKIIASAGDDRGISCLQIIAYRKLKGIGDNRYYPIIWYYNASMHNDKDFKSTLPYDACLCDDLVSDFLEKTVDGKKSTELFGKKRDDNKAKKLIIDKIIDNCGLSTKVDTILKAIGNGTSDILMENCLLELHCPAICYDRVTQSIFIVKRKERNGFPSAWEFGCAKASPSEHLLETVKKYYMDTFGLEIDLVINEGREQREPLPFAMYHVDKEGTLHKGVILFAFVVSHSCEKFPPEKFETRVCFQKDI